MQHIEDKSLLNGHIALILSEYDKAQDLFLSSPEPNTALEVQRQHYNNCQEYIYCNLAYIIYFNLPTRAEFSPSLYCCRCAVICSSGTKPSI